MLACEPSGSESGSVRTENTGTAQDPNTVHEETTLPETTQPSPEETRIYPETTGEATSSDPSPGGILSVVFLDVGQGSSALIRLPNGRNVLVDGGPRDGGPERVADLRRLGVDRLDAVVVSHADEDHAGGLIDVINSVPVSAVYDSGYPHETSP
jgi:beta-lactamase superfamily II metal-dependent hydrolase